MKEKRALFGFRPGDAGLILAVLAAAVLLCFLYLPGDSAGAVRIVSDSAVRTVPLDRTESYAVSSGGHSLTVSVENGSVRVTQSSCSGGDCMHTGAISRAGHSIVCMPGRVVVTIIGEESADADWILP
jgi:hypothetical protein